MRFNIYLAALAATTAFASPAAAQVVSPAPPPAEPTIANAPAQARGTVLLPLSLTKGTDLDFGTVLASSTPGWVEVNAEDGSRTADGAGVELVALNPGGRAEFTATGTANQEVKLTLAPPVGNVLNGPGGAQIAIANLRLNGRAAGVLNDTRRIGVGDTLLIGVGGRFNIAANQANGVYSANFTLTAEYN